MAQEHQQQSAVQHSHPPQPVQQASVIAMPTGKEKELQSKVHKLQTLLTGVASAAEQLTKQGFISPDAKTAQQGLEQMRQEIGE